MINYNGQLYNPSENLLSFANRAFKYGDALFETIKLENGKAIFMEDHYFRLMASMRMLRMEIPMHFTLAFITEEIVKTITANYWSDARIRGSVTEVPRVTGDGPVSVSAHTAIEQYSR